MMETGGSVGTEVNAAALRACCAKLQKKKNKICSLYRLDPVSTSFADVAAIAVEARIALTAFACVGT
jgi:hypothetical protein